jgi:4-amino-4-deoxy-L-arabinose transferase-like glycosyltransferase
MTPPADPGARKSIKSFLTTDASLTFLLVSLFILLFVLYPFVEPYTTTHYLLDVLSLLVLISGAYTVSDRRGVLLLCVGLAAVTFTLQILIYVSPDRLLLTLRVASLMLFLCVVTGAVLYKVLRKGRVTAHRVGGAIVVYLMLGLIWASAYSLIYIHDPASFDLGRSVETTDELSVIQTRGTGRLVYFSFVTMTTLGYGDVTPQSEAAGTLAILQALTGQIYLAVILARIVSLLVTRPAPE